jgi:sodium pump decarboxylase gamma subunit
MKKIRIFAILLAVFMIIAAMAVYVSAEEATSAVAEAESMPLRDLDGEDLTLTERIPYAVQGVVTGMLMVFAVLILLTIIVSASKYFFAPPVPKVAEEEPKVVNTPSAPTPAPAPAPAPVNVPVQTTSDDQLVAVITAAVAAMIDSSEEYRSEFASGFRVVSFKRVSSNGAWNKN